MEDRIACPYGITPSEFRQVEDEEFFYHPVYGFINTRDPWWLGVWIITFWVLIVPLILLVTRL